jgi:coenzyme F420-reducing hydrogenase delta subunit/ferredoxin
MQPRTDGRPLPRNAVVDPHLCTSCGICVGACPTSTPFRSASELVTGIDLPHRPLDGLRADLEAAVHRLDSGPRVVVFGCDYGADASLLAGPDTAAFALPCLAALPPSFIDYAIMRLGVAGVVLAGCGGRDCFHRLGATWTEQRLAGARDPYLRERVPRDRLALAWCGPHEVVRLAQVVEDLRRRVTAPEAMVG